MSIFYKVREKRDQLLQQLVDLDTKLYKHDHFQFFCESCNTTNLKDITVIKECEYISTGDYWSDIEGEVYYFCNKCNHHKRVTMLYWFDEHTTEEQWQTECEYNFLIKNTHKFKEQLLWYKASCYDPFDIEEIRSMQ